MKTELTSGMKDSFISVGIIISFYHFECQRLFATHVLLARISVYFQAMALDSAQGKYYTHVGHDFQIFSFYILYIFDNTETDVIESANMFENL